MTDAELRRQRVTFGIVIAVALVAGIAFAANAPDRSASQPSVAAALATTTTTVVPTDSTAPTKDTTAKPAADTTAAPTTTGDPGSLP
jgi:hypothetical protein